MTVPIPRSYQPASPDGKGTQVPSPLIDQSINQLSKTNTFVIVGSCSGFSRVGRVSGGLDSIPNIEYLPRDITYREQSLMDIRCTLKEVELSKTDNYFIVVQLTDTLHSYKYRTEIIPHSRHPLFYKNTFHFTNLSSIRGITIRLGLFCTQLQHEPSNEAQVLLESKSSGLVSLKLSQQQIFSIQQMQKENQKESHDLKFISGKSAVGSLRLQLEVVSLELEEYDRLEEKVREEVQFNPYEEDQEVISHNINKLEKILELRLLEYETMAQKLNSLSGTQKKVDLTYLKLKDHIQKLEKANIDITTKLGSKLDSLTIQASVELLKDSAQGQALLLQKMEYAKARLQMEEQEHAHLSLKFKEIEPAINQQIQQVERYNQLVHDVKDQEFQIERNNQLLQLYNTKMERLRANHSTIRSLKESMKKPDFTAKQALILLQDVKYKAKLQEYSKKDHVSRDNKVSLELLQRIEGAVKVIDKEEEEFEFLEPYEFKLQALRDQIQSMDQKISQSGR